MTESSPSADLAHLLKRDGFAILSDVFTLPDVESLRQAFLEIPAGEEIRKKRNVYGIRNLLEVSPQIRSLAVNPTLRRIVEPVLGDGCFAVRAIYFDKVPGANWNLQFHQDCTISVQRRIDTVEFKAWSTKAGVTQVQPPESILSQMLAIRIHLDDCLENNGPLRVLAGSHNRKWDADEIRDCRTRFPEQTCEVRLGGVLVMRPLVLHASSASKSPSHRRVIHIEYASQELPNGLEWNRKLRPVSES